jgi:hypothetical protein
MTNKINRELSTPQLPKQQQFSFSLAPEVFILICSRSIIIFREPLLLQKLQLLNYLRQYLRNMSAPLFARSPLTFTNDI